jgi:hypothetical protein
MALSYMDVWQATITDLGGAPVVPMAEWAWIVLTLIVSILALYLARSFVSNF